MAESQIYDKCGKAIQKFVEKGDDFDLSDYLVDIAAAKNALLAILHELTSKKTTTKKMRLAECARRALQDTNPTANYTRYEIIIYDIAAVCVILSLLEDGLNASEKKKMMDARMFCLHMKHELDELENPQE